MFGLKKKEVKKIKFSRKNALILSVSVVCGIGVLHYLYYKEIKLAILLLLFALFTENHLEYDIYEKKDESQ